MISLVDWRCEGPYQGRTCNRVLTAYDPAQMTVAVLRRTQQQMCPRCKHVNGLPLTEARRPAPLFRLGGDR